MTSDNPLGNLTSFPLCKRGTEGDFCVHITLKSPLAPLLQRGECVVIARIRSNGLSGIVTDPNKSADNWLPPTVRPERVEGFEVVRQALHERVGLLHGNA